jgi:hypothetical protein
MDVGAGSITDKLGHNIIPDQQVFIHPRRYYPFYGLCRLIGSIEQMGHQPRTGAD